MTSADTQISMALTPEDTDAPDKVWLGLVTDHRRLFGALQDGWLHPLPSDTGTLLGIERYVTEENAVQEGHPIEIHLKLNPEKLPDLGGGRASRHRMGNSIYPDRRILGHCTVLARGASDLRQYRISPYHRKKKRVRLNGMARFASNLILDEECGESRYRT